VKNDLPQSDSDSGFWPKGWWKIMETKIGIFPLPIFFILAGLLYYFVQVGKIPTEAAVMMAVLAFFGFACGEAGKHLPVLKHLGAAAIFATFIPSFLVYKHWLPTEMVKDVSDFTKSTNFLYLFIAAIIVGSIFGMDRKVLIQGFLKIVVPISAGSVLAAGVGTAVGTALGLGTKHTFFYVVLPIMAGGVGEGAIPLSTGYSDILHGTQSDLFAQVLPPVMLGSLVAILLAGVLNMIGRKYPKLTGNGRLQPDENDDLGALQSNTSGVVDVGNVAAAGITAITLYIVGLVSYRAFGWPAAVVMLFLAVGLKLAHAIPPKLQEGAYTVYRFFAIAVTYPLLFAIGAVLTPWDKLVAAFAVPNLITIAATVITMVTTGFFVGRWINLYPIDMAIVNSCRCGQGGTGDVAILTASERMQLMPFAQVATRIGGGLTVIIGLSLYAKYH
jgi:malate:Na+ symporter